MRHVTASLNTPITGARRGPHPAAQQLSSGGAAGRVPVGDAEMKSKPGSPWLLNAVGVHKQRTKPKTLWRSALALAALALLTLNARGATWVMICLRSSR